MLSLNAFFLIILLLLLFMSVLDNIYFSKFIQPMKLVGKLTIPRAYKYCLSPLIHQYTITAKHIGNTINCMDSGAHFSALLNKYVSIRC